MKNICIALFVILLLQSTKAGDSIGTTTTTVTPISGSDYCSAFIYKCVASGKQDDGVASPNTASADGITFAWTLKIDGNAAPSFVENTDYWVKSDSTFSTTTATSYIILRPKLFTSVTKGANVLTCTQTQKVGSTPVTTAAANAASISATNDAQLTVAKADATCAAAPVLTLTESSGCNTIEAFIKGGVVADDKMYVLGTDAAVLGTSTLQVSTTYTVVAIKKDVVANTVTTVTLAGSANCLITAADVSTKTDPCNVQVISFEYASVASSTVGAIVSKTASGTTTSIADTKYYVQEVTPASGKSKSVVIVQSKTFAASDVVNISLGFQKDNVLRLGSKSVTMTNSAQATCDSKAMTSDFSNDCQKNTISASTATTAWTYYGLDTTFTAPTTASDKVDITKKGIYIADLSTTTGTAVIKQEYIQVTDLDCVKITQDSTTTSTDRCAAMSFTCVTNITTPTPTFAWTNSPSTATLSSTLNAAGLTIAKDVFKSTDAATQTLTCKVNNTKSAQLPITLVATACSSGNGSGSGSGDDDDDSSSVLSILALLLVALLL